MPLLEESEDCSSALVTQGQELMQVEAALLMLAASVLQRQRRCTGH